VYILFSIILGELATKLGLARTTEPVDNEPLLRIILLRWRRKVKYVSELLQLEISPSEDATDGLWKIEMLI
jgi:hypothetical protein